MTQQKCECESSVVAAARSGVYSADLEYHIIACEICAETKRIAGLFQHVATISAQNQPPSANIVWEKLQAKRQQLALTRATRCMALMRILAALYAIALAAWYLPQLWQTQPAQLSKDLGALSGGAIFAGVLTAVVAVVLGSCCLVLLGSKTDSRLHT